jgi:NAD(P)-dependent dehydrogenase (short-subunit alcohol dehydrogenase family)
VGHDAQSKVIVITGASSGFGKAAAECLASAGHHVHGLSIDAARPARNPNGTLQHFQVDIRSERAVRNAIRTILNKEKRIDVLVNNAGFGVAGAVDETSTEEGQDLFNVNLWGLHRLCRHVVPQMRRQGFGIIINMSSFAGLYAIPFQGIYSASKYAIEGMSEALSMELKPFGIRVYLIEPGDGATAFLRNRRYARQIRRSAYGATFRSVMDTVEHDEENGFPPDVVGARIMRIVNRRPRRFRHLVGNRVQVLMLRLKHLTPHRLFEGGALRMFGAHAAR